MPQYSIEDHSTGATILVEGDSPPTEQEAAQIIAEHAPAAKPAEPKNLRPRRDQLQKKASAVGSAEPKPDNSGLDQMFETGLEVGIPTVVQAVTSPLAETGVTSAAGAISSGLGNMLAQLNRINRGAQKNFDTGQNASATAIGAIPFALLAKPTASTSKGVIMGALSNAGEIAKTGTAMGAAGVGAKAIETTIDEGRMPTLSEDAQAFALPAAFGSAVGATGLLSEKAGSIYASLKERMAPFEKVGVEPTPGMVFPEKFAATEGRMAKKGASADSAPGQAIAAKIDKAQSQFDTGLRGVAGFPEEGATLIEKTRPLVGQVTVAEESLSELNDAAKRATQVADDATAKLDAIRASNDAAAVTEATQHAAKASEEAFNANLGSVVENARALAQARIAGPSSGIDPATARTLFVDHVAAPLKGAFEKRANDFYSQVDNKAEVFDAAPLRAKAKEIADEITGGLPKTVSGALATVDGALVDAEGNALEKVSLQRLRNIREDLLARANSLAATDNERRLLKQTSRSITDIIDTQAVDALGEEGGTALREGNKFYRETKPLFEDRGTEVLFSGKPSDSYVTSFVDGMMKSGGVMSDEYQNVQKLISSIAKFSPETASLAQDHVNGIIKDSILYRSARIDPSSASGAVAIDTESFLKSLGALGASKGTLEQLGLGSRSAVAELQILSKKYPSAINLGEDEWNALFGSPAFQDASAGRLATELEPALAKRAADIEMIKASNLAAGGKYAEAKAAADEAKTALVSVSVDAATAKDNLAKLKADPVANAFNNPRLSTEDFNRFARAFFDPKANVLNNEQVRAMVSALEGSKNPAHAELLERWRQRYIADRISSLTQAPGFSSSAEWQNVDKITQFFGADPREATSELARAKAILTPEQLARLAEFGEAAKQLAKFQSAAGASGGAASMRSPRGTISSAVGTGSTRSVSVRASSGIIDVAVGLWGQAKYNLAAEYLMNPTKLAATADRAATVSGFMDNVGTKRAILLLNQNPAMRAELEPDK